MYIDMIEKQAALSTRARDRHLSKFLLANPFLVDPPFLLGMFWENKFYSQIVLAEVDQYVLFSIFAVYLRI